MECTSLVAAGYGVSVICPRGPAEARREVIDGVSIRRYAPPPVAKGLPGYVWEFLYCWIVTAFLAVRIFVSEGFDAIQACNPPDTYFLLALPFKLLRRRFVYDQHDLCPEVYRARFSRSTGPALRALYGLERATY
ncbi:MAG TPA: glycosyltransferase, partial [Candidatus Dormibacteraeota bacterium]|nr:glycosyltransferase [Candidatus Dormibacteraeota bacterium]